MNAFGNAAGCLGFLLGVSISQLIVWVVKQIKTIYKNKCLAEMAQQVLDGNKKSIFSTKNKLFRKASLSADVESKLTMDTRTEEEGARIHYVVDTLI